MKLFYAVWLIFLVACNINKEKKVAFTEAKFTTSDASELFFKNIRQTAYDREDLTAGKMIINRMAGRTLADNHPVINLAIVINWRYDESYILIEPNRYFETFETITVIWKNSKNESRGDYIYEKGNKEAQFLFASYIYTSLLRGDILAIKSDGDTLTPFLTDNEEREIFRKTMVDYYRLVDLL